MNLNQTCLLVSCRPHYLSACRKGLKHWTHVKMRKWKHSFSICTGRWEMHIIGISGEVIVSFSSLFWGLAKQEGIQLDPPLLTQPQLLPLEQCLESTEWTKTYCQLDRQNAAKDLCFQLLFFFHPWILEEAAVSCMFYRTKTSQIGW